MTWVDADTPWYANSCARNLAAMTCTGVCWLAAMDRYMGMQQVDFQKTCMAFVAAPVSRAPEAEARISGFVETISKRVEGISNKIFALS